MISQHWFRNWLVVVRYQVITLVAVDPVFGGDLWSQWVNFYWTAQAWWHIYASENYAILVPINDVSSVLHQATDWVLILKNNVQIAS